MYSFEDVDWKLGLDLYKSKHHECLLDLFDFVSMEAVGLAERILVSAYESVFAIEEHPVDKVEGGCFSAELPDSIAGSVVVGLDDAAVLQVEGRHQID